MNTNPEKKQCSFINKKTNIQCSVNTEHISGKCSKHQPKTKKTREIWYTENKSMQVKSIKQVCQNHR